jgi:hypothetical protein
MVLAAKVDEFGRLGWIAATVLGFMLFWPIGLAILAFLAFSGRLRAGCGDWGNPWWGSAGRWYNTAQQGGGRGGCGWGWGGRHRPPPSSGNAAFDEYRAETLRRLEEEQKEFVEYLERLRRAKDKAEFDQFMAERRRRTEPPPESPEGR